MYLKPWVLSCLLLLAVPATGEKGDPAVLCENLLAAPKGCALNRAFAGFWLGRDLAEANVQLAEAWQSALGDHAALTPEVADEQFKWQMRTWVRIYYLFGPGARAALSPENTARTESLLWNYACAKSSLARADLKYVWFIQGSENHDMMDLGNVFLAAQALVDNADYRVRTLPDGGTLRAHVEAWTAYFTRYCEERARHGLLIEFGSPTYGKYYVPELVNLYDFSKDSTLRARVEVYLHLVWADWALEQLNCIRGGARARCYQGDYSRKGASDSWYAMGQLLLGTGDWANAGRYNHPILGYGLALSTSGYSLPEVVAALATSPETRGEYVYQSRRPGRMAHVGPLPPLGGHSCWYNMAPEDSRFLRYSWCTPDHVLGSYTLDPALREDYQIYPAEPDRASAHYAAITAQNLWQGVLFNTGPDARIFPQCLAAPDRNKPDLSTTYVQQVAVQHENVLLVRANRAHPAIRAFQIYVGPGMKERIVEHGGWYLLKEGSSFVAIRFFPEEAEDKAPEWQDENFLRANSAFTPAAIVTGRTAHFASLDEFLTYLGQHQYGWRDGGLEYTFKDCRGKTTSLGLPANARDLPTKNGSPVDLAPSGVRDVPFIQPGPGPDAITIRFNGLEQALHMAG